MAPENLPPLSGDVIYSESPDFRVNLVVLFHLSCTFLSAGVGYCSTEMQPSSGYAMLFALHIRTRHLVSASNPRGCT